MNILPKTTSAAIVDRTVYKVQQNISAYALPFWIFYYGLSIGILIFGFHYLPMNDYADWAYQGMLWREYLLHGSIANGYYHLHSFIPPNCLSTLFIGLLTFIFSTDLSGRIVLAASMFLLVNGCFRYLRIYSAIDRVTAFHAAIWCSVSLHFFMGYINFLLGLGIAFYILSRDGWAINRELAPKHIGWFILLYLSHPITLAIAVLQIAITIIVEKRWDRIGQLLFYALPAITLCWGYLLSDSHPVSGSYGLYFPVLTYPHHPLFIPTMVLKPFQFLKGLPQVPLPLRGVNIFTSIFFWVVVGYALVRMILYRSFIPSWWIVVVCVGAFIMLPEHLLGVIVPAERLVVFCFLNALVCIYIPPIKKHDWLKTFFSSMIVLTLTYMGYNYSLVNAIVQHTSSAQRVNYSNKHEGIDPFTRLVYYQYFDTPQAIPIFPTGLFTYDGVDSLDGDLKILSTYRSGRGPFEPPS